MTVGLTGIASMAPLACPIAVVSTSVSSMAPRSAIQTMLARCPMSVCNAVTNEQRGHEKIHPASRCAPGEPGGGMVIDDEAAGHWAATLAPRWARGRSKKEIAKELMPLDDYPVEGPR